MSKLWNNNILLEINSIYTFFCQLSPAVCWLYWNQSLIDPIQQEKREKCWKLYKNSFSCRVRQDNYWILVLIWLPENFNKGSFISSFVELLCCTHIYLFIVKYVFVAIFWRRKKTCYEFAQTKWKNRMIVQTEHSGTWKNGINKIALVQAEQWIESTRSQIINDESSGKQWVCQHSPYKDWNYRSPSWLGHRHSNWK